MAELHASGQQTSRALEIAPLERFEKRSMAEQPFRNLEASATQSVNSSTSKSIRWTRHRFPSSEGSTYVCFGCALRIEVEAPVLREVALPGGCETLDGPVLLLALRL